MFTGFGKYKITKGRSYAEKPFNTLGNCAESKTFCRRGQPSLDPKYGVRVHGCWLDFCYASLGCRSPLLTTMPHTSAVITLPHLKPQVSSLRTAWQTSSRPRQTQLSARRQFAASATCSCPASGCSTLQSRRTERFARFLSRAGRLASLPVLPLTRLRPPPLGPSQIH